MHLPLLALSIAAALTLQQASAAVLFSQSGSITETTGGTGPSLVNTSNDVSNWITAGGYDTGSAVVPLYFSLTINVTNNNGETTGGGFFTALQFYKSLTSERFALGNHWFSRNWGGFRGPGDFDLTGNQPVVINTLVNFIFKLDQASNSITVWMKPNVALTESDQAPGMTTVLTGLGTSDEFDSINLRGNGSTTFSNISIRNDSPFAPVPEPSSSLLSILGVLALLRRNR